MNKILFVLLLLFSTPLFAGDLDFIPDPNNIDGSVTLQGAATTSSFYVSTTGSDSNDCSATAKCLTIQKALDKVGASLVPGSVSIYVADGTYVENLYFPSLTGKAKDTTYGNSYVEIIGNETTPSNVVVKPASGTVVRMYDSLARLRGVQFEGTSTSSTQAGFAIFRSRLYFKNVIFKNLGTFVQLNEISDATYESGSTAGQTWTGAGAGTLFTVNTNSRLTLSSSATLNAGTGTTTMIAVVSNSRLTTVALNLYGGTATHTGLTASNSSAISIGGHLRIEDITATPSTYANAAIRVSTNATYFQSGSTNLIVDNVQNVFFLNGAASMSSSGTGTVGTYTNVSGKWLVTDNTSILDAQDAFDPPTPITVGWNAARNPGYVQLNKTFNESISTASANDLTLDPTANYHRITGSTTINCISTANLYEIHNILRFESNITITDQATCSAGYAPIILASAGGDFIATASSTLTIVYDSGVEKFVEVGRTTY